MAFSILARRSAKSTRPRTGSFLRCLGLAPSSSLDFGTFASLSLALAREEAVDAADTGCLGRELRKGGDFGVVGAIILARRVFSGEPGRLESPLRPGDGGAPARGGREYLLTGVRALVSCEGFECSRGCD